MDHDTIEWLRQRSGAWRLLSSDNVAFTLGFLARIFVDENIREISEPDLVDRLDDELYALNRRLGEGTYPKSAKAYLADWSSSGRGWLRRYYPHGSDEAHYDATPEIELAASWVRDLTPRDFVGTESRLNTIVELLKQMVYGTETDPAARRAELERKREALDAEIARLDGGHVDVMSPVEQRDRFQQFAKMARELLADFRQVEENFRGLDRELREQIASWDGSKADLLDEVLGSRTSIDGSPQGQSFAAFFDFLLSADSRAEFSALLEKVHDLEDIGPRDARLRYVHHDWHAAGERTQSTVRLLSEQLRKFLDDQAWLENRRIMDLIAGIQSRAIDLKHHDADGLTTELDAAGPTIVLPTERPLFAPQRQIQIDSAIAESHDIELDAAALYEQVNVDSRELASSVQGSLRHVGRIGLTEHLDQQPLTHGIAELVTYISLRDESFETLIDDEVRDSVRLDTTDGSDKIVRFPRVTYVDRYEMVDR